ncbi:MAG: c-type cytochrome [Dinoroseobacter sp.]|nr:c-type cytochrome [Dinoroseobacter sp.]
MKRLFLAVVIATGAGPAHAQDISLGEYEYRNSCAACHGAEGRGNGPVSAHMSKPAPNLRTLSSDNGGVFPVSRVYEVIDGSAGVGAHGMMDMPVWGYRFTQRVGSEDTDFSAEDVSNYARIRILAVIDHLAGLQDG